MKILWFALIVLASQITATPGPATWIQEERTDAFSGMTYSRFSLSGVFLTPPNRPPDGDGPPMLIMDCKPGRFDVGHHLYRDGNILKTTVKVGALLPSPDHATVSMMSRKDQDYIEASTWSWGPDQKSMFLNGQSGNLIYRYHGSKDKRDKDVYSEPVHRLTLSVKEEWNNNDVVMLFDIPDSSALVVPCGLILQKKQQSALARSKMEDQWAKKR